MTREEVSKATALFLAHGGQIQRIGEERAVSHQIVMEEEWREVWDLISN